MLSYRHEFHAGNHADVLKHIVQIAILDYLVEKDKPLTYIDTHSGPGIYQLTGNFASKNREYKEGVGRLKGASHPLIERYATFFDDNWYAGSVNIAQQILRPTDKIRCFELHGSDFSRLLSNTNTDKRVKCFDSDGFKGLISQVPPLTKRGLSLVDPSYELPADYHHVANTLKAAIKRFANGVYMVWYPLLERPEVGHMQRKLNQLSANGKPVHILNVELQVRHRSPGMYGSGLCIINPPWNLEAQLRSIMPILVTRLGEGEGQFSITHKNG